MTNYNKFSTNGLLSELLQKMNDEAGESGTDRDTQGNPVPTYKPHEYTYDGSGNLLTDTVSDDTGSWVRTYAYTNGALVSDSGWVKQ